MIKKVFPPLALSVFLSMLGSGIIVPLLPLYAQKLGASGIWIGIIFAGFAVSSIVITPIAGRLSDRRGRKLFLLIGFLSFPLVSLAYIWADIAPQLTLARLIEGVAFGLIQPISQAYIGDTAPKGEEGKWMGYFGAATFTAFGVGPLMGGALADHFGMTVAFATMGGLNILAFLIATLFLPEIEPRKMTASSRLSFKEMSTSGTVKGLFSFQLASALGRGAFIAFLPIFTGTYIGLSPTLIGILIAASMLLMSSLQVYGGRIADRFNRRALVIINSLAGAASLALIPLGGNFWQLLGICALGGISAAMAVPAALALSVEEGRRFGMGSTMAIFTMTFSIGMGIGPLLGGVMADFVGINSVFYLGAILGLTGTGLFFSFVRR